MRLLCFSDTHGNVDSVKRMLDDIHRRSMTYDSIIFAGDFTNYWFTGDLEGARKEFLEILILLNAECKNVFYILGNRDIGLLDKTGAISGKSNRKDDFKPPENGVLLMRGKWYDVGNGIKITADRSLVDENTILVEHNNELKFILGRGGEVLQGLPILMQMKDEMVLYKNLKEQMSKLKTQVTKTKDKSEVKKIKEELVKVNSEMDSLGQRLGQDKWYNVSKKALLHVAGHTHQSEVVKNYLNTGFLYRDGSHGAKPLLGCYFDVEISNGLQHIKCNSLSPFNEHVYVCELGECRQYTQYPNCYPQHFFIT